MWFRGILGQVGIEWVRAPILVPFAVVLLFVVGGFVLTVVSYEERQSVVEMEESVRAVGKLFDQKLEYEGTIVRGAIEAMTQNMELGTTLRRGAQADLAAIVSPLFGTFQKSLRLSRLQVFDPESEPLLDLSERQRDEESEPDGLRSDMIAKAIDERTATSGLVLSKDGGLRLTLFFPWYDNDRLLAVLVTEKPVGSIIDDVHLALDLVILPTAYKMFLDRARWEATARNLGIEEGWERFTNSARLDAVVSPLPVAAVQALGELGHHHYDFVRRIEEQGSTQLVSFLPLVDIQSNEIGDLVVIRDITASADAFHGFIWVISAIGGAAGLIVFVLFFIILGRMEREHNRQRDIERQFARLSTEHQKIVQIEKLSEVGRTIGEIAHQINNPLVGVINMAQLAEREADDPTRSRELLNQIRRAGEHCRMFVSRMLQFTRVSRMERAPTNAAALVRDTVSLFLQSAEVKPTIDLNLPEPGPTLEIDPVLVRHALFNLISNAAQAIDENGTISVSLSESARKDDGEPGWRLSVADTGHGLTKDVHEKLFSPFFTTRKTGTGLGLPVVQHVAFLHGGDVTAQNRSAGGADFAIWLPEAVPSNS